MLDRPVEVAQGLFDHESRVATASELACVHRLAVIREIDFIPNAEAAWGSAAGAKFDEIADKPDAAVGKTDVYTARVHASGALFKIRAIAVPTRHAQLDELSRATDRRLDFATGTRVVAIVSVAVGTVVVASIAVGPKRTGTTAAHGPNAARVLRNQSCPDLRNEDGVARAVMDVVDSL